MGKALKPLVIVLLVLSIVSLVLGSLLFSQREVLKGRTLKYEEAVQNIAGKLRFDGLNVEALKDYDKMGPVLNTVAVAADNQYEDLQNTKQDLADTREELAATKDELEDTKTELAQARQEINDLEDTVEQKDAELAIANGRITQLEQDKANLQIQIDDLNDQLVSAEEEMRDCQDKVATLDKIIKDLEAEIGGVVGTLPPGLTGRVLFVNPDWNFVVLDIGSEQGLVSNAELLIQRDEELVGKVRISSVEKNMAVAEIMRDWQQLPVNEGDYVFF